MLYISRLFNRGGQTLYGVVDTDDDKEEISTYAHIAFAVRRLGIEIKGAEIVEDFGENVTVDIWQDPRYMTAAQTKASLLGVQVVLFRGMAVEIYGHDLKHVQLRLSSVTNTLWKYASINFMSCDDVTLILDDTVEVGELVQDAHCCKWDLREVTREDTAKAVYKRLFRSGTSFELLASTVKDKERRGLYWQYACVPHSGVGVGSQCMRELRERKDYPKISDFVARLYIDTFEMIATWDILNDVDKSRLTRVLGVTDYAERDVLFYKDCKDFDVLKNAFMGVLEVFDANVNTNSAQMFEFRTFIKYFEASDYIKNLFVMYCNHVAEALYRAGRA